MKKMYISVSKIPGGKQHRVRRFVEAFYYSNFDEAVIVWLGEYSSVHSAYETIRVSARKTHLNVKVHLVDDVLYFDR